VEVAGAAGAAGFSDFALDSAGLAAGELPAAGFSDPAFAPFEDSAEEEDLADE